MRFSILSFLLYIAFHLPLSADETCKDCHQSAFTAWSGSHHAASMMPATQQSVLGDFNTATFTHYGQSATFTNAKDYTVTIKTKDGLSSRYKIAYTFGVSPLQQYLVEMPDGKYQVLPYAWDTRVKSKGGQRWFHIYGPENIKPHDRRHWQQPIQNWNGMCADCHSSGLKRQYDLTEDSFKTNFSSVNVSCMSCHAGAETHAGLQRKTPKPLLTWKDDLVAYLQDSDDFQMTDHHHTAIKRPSKKPHNTELNICAACHSLRAPLGDGINPEKSFLDQFTPSLLEDPLYFPDGQIKEEVYVWGSFLQSKMHQAGVTCSHCHDSHSLNLKAEDNALCNQCHKAKIFDTREHHQHPVGSAGALCVNCHMPARIYMGVDPRRDHSFTVPRPDISVATGSPNACTSCHVDESPEWAKSHVQAWHPDSLRIDLRAITVHQAQMGNPLVRSDLAKIIADETEPDIKRASALALIPSIASDQLIDLAIDHLESPSAIIRMGAIRALAATPSLRRYGLLETHLKDPVKAVRMEAARSLLGAEQADLMDTAFQELFQVDSMTSWRGEGRVNLAQHALARGDLKTAEATYRQSLKQDPAFTPALINLNAVLRQSGRGAEAHSLLQSAAENPSADSAVLHAYGLSLVRQGGHDQALAFLKTAAKQGGENPRYMYVYLVALHSRGQAKDVQKGLINALQQHPYDRDLINFARALAHERGDTDVLKNLNKRLLELSPIN